MKLDKFVFIIVCVLFANYAAFWVSALVIAAVNVPYGWLALIPAALAGYVVYLVIAQRVGNPTEDHYDGIEH